jgi:hypothetical protein
MQRPLLVFSLALAAATLACGSDTTPPPVSKIITFQGSLSPNNENPPITTSQGTGTFKITLDTSTNVLTWDVQVSGLTTNINNGHIHGPALPNVNTGVLLNFNPANTTQGIPGSTFSGFGTANTGRAQGTYTLTSALLPGSTANTGDSLKKWLLAGMTYVNVHTTQNGGGEVRAQLVKP